MGRAQAEAEADILGVAEGFFDGEPASIAFHDLRRGLGRERRRETPRLLRIAGVHENDAGNARLVGDDLGAANEERSSAAVSTRIAPRKPDPRCRVRGREQVSRSTHEAARGNRRSCRRIREKPRATSRGSSEPQLTLAGVKPDVAFPWTSTEPAPDGDSFAVTEIP